MARIRLGSFELDPASGELFSSETPVETVVLREQPLRVLRLLVESAPDLVTREVIKGKLWPNDTIVDFDHSINVSIGVLRRALGDSATSPRYIETVARRGYRLLVPVGRVKASPAPPAAAVEKERGPAPVELVAARPTAETLVGRKVSHYRVLELIGGGGMGMVYKAEDLKLGRRVALKFLPEELSADSAALRLLEREARTASSLNHPNICTIYDIEELDGQPFIAMELLEGETLHQRLPRDDDPLSLSAALEIAIGACDGLEAAHERGIVHRDIKPANLFLTRAGVVKILDFGVAKLLSGDGDDADGASTDGPIEDDDAETPRNPATRSLSRSTFSPGTPSYMSPEQVRGEPLDVRTDIFSLGLVLYEMAAGVRPFEGDTRAAIQDAIVNTRPVPARARNASVPRELDRVIAKALEKGPSQRYQSAAEMRADLERIQRLVRPARRRARAWLAGAAALTVAAAGAWLYRDYRHRVTLAPSDTIVLAEFRNQSGDKAFDEILTVAARYGLEQTPYLNVLAPDKVFETLSALRLSATAELTPDVARQVALRTNSRIVIAPTIADAGNGFRIELAALEAPSGATIARVREDAATRDGVVHAVGVAESKMRRLLGEPPASLARFDRPLDEATSASPEVLQLANAAHKTYRSADWAGAETGFRRALELDPRYALAYVALGSAYERLDNDAAAVEAETKAFELRDRMTEPHRLLAEYFYYDTVTGEQEKACAVASRRVQTYPRDVLARPGLARCLEYFGQHDRAADEMREAVRLSPSASNYDSWIGASISAGRLEEARAAFDEAEKRGLINAWILRWRLLLAFLQEDETTIQELRARAEKKPWQEGWWGLSQIEATRGRFRAARSLGQRETEEAARAGRAWNSDLRLGLWEAEVGDSKRALAATASLAAGNAPRSDRVRQALTLARAGETKRRESSPTNWRRTALSTRSSRRFAFPPSEPRSSCTRRTRQPPSRFSNPPSPTTWRFPTSSTRSIRPTSAASRTWSSTTGVRPLRSSRRLSTIRVSSAAAPSCRFHVSSSRARS